jgi:nucleoside-diphosphate-sugar epimerase
MVNVIVLGGVGFIGRNFIKFLVDNKLAERIRVVDKVLPATAFLGRPHADAFAHPSVEFMQGNLTSVVSIAKCFNEGDHKWDFCINFAAETKYGQTEAVYEEKVLDLARKCGEEAKKHGVRKFVHFSTAQVYAESKKPVDENGNVEPWTMLAKYSLLAEEALRKLGLPLVIFRPVVVYGPADVGALSARLICAAVYKFLGKKMKFMWDGDLAYNTVHVDDVVAAVWVACEKAKDGSLFNLADESSSTQGSLNKLFEKIFGIKTGFEGKLISTVAKTKMADVAEYANDKHLKPWSELCKNAGIANTPLTPYVDQELLYNNPLNVDGSKICKELGFKYSKPRVTEELLRDQLKYFIDQKLYPAV